MENKIIATRYCLNNEDEKSYSELFIQSENWKCGLINPDSLLKIPPPPFEFKNDECKLPIEGNLYSQREEDLKNNPEVTLTISEDMISGNNLSEEETNDLIEKFYSQPIQIQRFPSIGQAVEKLCEELKNDEDYYRSWKDNIAIAFKDEFWKKINVDGMIGDNIYIIYTSNQNVHEIANNAADNFLKRLISK